MDNYNYNVSAAPLTIDEPRAATNANLIFVGTVCETLDGVEADGEEVRIQVHGIPTIQVPRHAGGHVARRVFPPPVLVHLHTVMHT